MASEEKRPIVIKRIKKMSAGAHGGAWKIAYADFVTAMMAFFLLMWLLGSTAKGDLNGISEYFKTPLKVALMGGDGSGDATSIIKGGGQDLTRTEGQVKKSNDPSEKRVINLKTAIADMMKMEKDIELEKLKELKKSIEKAINNNANLAQFKDQILLDITSDGLRIQIVDEKNRPMFKLGRSELEPYTKDILHEIGKTMNQLPNKVSLSGHTDAHPFSTDRKGFSNWDLSAERANASRRELIVGGMDEAKVVRVVGMSSAVLFDTSDPFNPINRRISIIVMNKKAEETAQHDGGIVEMDAENGDVRKISGVSGVSAASSPAAVPAALPAAH
ncbi:MAG: flagellar motor protein MotB [Gallionellaceae bacterium]|jgi:chemotaxis protein MotB